MGASNSLLHVGLQNSKRSFVTLDGQIGYPVLTGETVVVDEHPSPVKLVRVSGRSFFEVLRRKLRWGVR